MTTLRCVCLLYTSQADRTPVVQHERRFNAPAINKVASVLVAEEFDGRDIIIKRRNEAFNALKKQLGRMTQ